MIIIPPDYIQYDPELYLHSNFIEFTVEIWRSDGLAMSGARVKVIPPNRAARRPIFLENGQNPGKHRFLGHILVIWTSHISQGEF